MFETKKKKPKTNDEQINKKYQEMPYVMLRQPISSLPSKQMPTANRRPKYAKASLIHQSTVVDKFNASPQLTTSANGKMYSKSMINVSSNNRETIKSPVTIINQYDNHRRKRFSQSMNDYLRQMDSTINRNSYDDGRPIDDADYLYDDINVETTNMQSNSMSDDQHTSNDDLFNENDLYEGFCIDVLRLIAKTVCMPIVHLSESAREFFLLNKFFVSCLGRSNK